MSNLRIVTPAARPVVDREVRSPYRCWCCKDSGLVASYHAEQYLANPSPVPQICQRPNCTAGQAYLSAYWMSDDQRNQYSQAKSGKDSYCPVMPAAEYQAAFGVDFTPAHCDEFHRLESTAWWDNYRARRGAPRPEVRAQIAALAAGMSANPAKEAS